MSRTLLDVDRDALSQEAARVFDEIAWPLVVEDEPPAKIAEKLGLSTSDIADAMDFLGAEVEAQLGGATLPPLEDAQYQLLKADIEARGQLYPVLLDRAGKVIDGSNVLRACKELGIEPETKTVDVEDEHATRLAAQLTRRHLTSAQKRRIIRAELLRDEDRSNRELAALIGVDDKTVGSVRAQLEQLRLTLRHARKGGSTTPAPAAKRAKVSVEKELYNALVDLAHKAAAYYGRYEDQHRDPELEQAFGRWHAAKLPDADETGGEA